MGSYTFKWDLPADEVYVTGTFDGWTKSVKLDKEEGIFQKNVDFEDASKKIYYKFVVDNNWVLDESAPKEPDHEGNINNFLTPEQIAEDAPTPAVINTVAPTATTAAMAGEQPIEKKPEEAPVASAAVDASVDAPATEPQATPSDIPGGFPATPANELDKTIGVNPLPAAEGGINPVTLAPGEKVPETVAAGSTTSNVKLDKESYEKSDALPGVTSITSELPPVLNTTIPESSLPIADPTDITINSVVPTSTTAALAGEVPLESKVPEVVKESQEEAGAAPEASAVPEEVNDKAKVEEELKDKVPEVAPTSEGTSGVGTEKTEDSAGLAALAATAGGAVVSSAIAVKDAIQEKAAPAVNDATKAATDAANNSLPDSVKEKLPVAAQEALASTNKEKVREEVSPEVPAEVKESIAEAGESPEAAASTTAVEEKKEVEAELLKEVKPAPAVDDVKADGDETAAEAESQVKSKIEEVKEEVKSAVKSEEPAQTEPAATTPAETKPETATTAANGAENGAENGTRNGTSTSEPKAATNGTPVETKKKNRLSAMFSKLKHKISDKK